MRILSLWAKVFMSICFMAFTAFAQSNTATGNSTAFNPAISINGLFLGFYGSDPLSRGEAFGDLHHREEEGEHEGEEHDEEGEAHEEEAHGHGHGLPDENGLSIQEIELRFTSTVDAYFKADMTLAIPGTEGIEVETAEITTTNLPNLTIKAGKFFADLGKHNALHTHAFPFLDAPIAHERILGGEGLNEIGVSANLLLPTAWYSEFTLQLFNGDNERFNSADSGDMAYLAKWKNLWDLSDDTTLELGGTYAFGKNSHAQYTNIFSGDLTFKWRPSRRTQDRGFILQAEYLQARLNDGADTEKVGGLYALAQYQFARRWWIQSRYDIFGLPKLEPNREHRISSLIAFAPSEFSALRLQHSYNKEGNKSIHQFALQLNFTIGAHPAHAY